MTAGAAEDAAAAPAAAAPEPEPVKGESAAEAAQREAEQKARAAHEDRVLERGRAVRGLRALLARAYTAPAREPSRRGGAHWDAVLGEARWLAADVAQERLWKGAAALAVAAEVAGKRGDFGLRAPPEGFRAAHDEIAAARAAAAAGPAAAPARPGKRRGKSESEAAAPGAIAAPLADFASDPVWADLAPMLDELSPGTPPRVEAHAAFAYACDGAFDLALDGALCARALARDIESESALRSYRFELESALDAHFAALGEANRRAMRLDADLAGDDLSDGGIEDEADGLDLGLGGAAGKRAGKRGAAARAGARRAGYLLDDFAELPDAALEFSERAPAQRRASAAGAAAAGGGATSRQYIEDTYLRKRRRERYRESDVDYDASAEHAGSASRYGTRRATGALAARPGQRPGGGAPDAAAAKRLRVAGRPDAGARGAPGAARGPGAPAVAWSKPEDELLLATVHEFGLNWTLVSEVLSLSLALQGVYRPPALCRQRFRALTLSADADYSEERALAALGQRLSKAQARELLVAALPARDDALCRALETLVQVGAAAKQRRLAEEKRGDAARTRRQDPHASHASVVGHVLGQTGGRRLSPLELSAAVNNAYLNQAKQQAAMAEQQTAAPQVAAPPAPQANPAAAQQQAAVPPGQPAAVAVPRPSSVGPMGVVPGAPGAPHPGVLAGPAPLAQGQVLSGGSPAPGSSGAVSPAPGVGTPGLPPHAGMGVGPVPGAQPPGVPGFPPGVLMPGVPGVAPGSTPTAPAPAPAQLPKPAQPPQITLQQLNHILGTNKLPNGQPLSPEMRDAIQKKRDAYLAQMQAAQLRQQQIAQQMQMQAAAAAAAAAARGGAGQVPGQGQGPSPLPGGLAGYPGGPGGVAGLGLGPGQLLPPGVQLAHGGVALPHGTATLAAAQQQMLAQQLLAHQHQQQAQQHAAAAAAAAAAAGQQASSQQSHPASQTTTAG